MGQITRWLVIVNNDMKPGIIGPFRTDEARDQAAKRHKQAYGDNVGIYPLNIGYEKRKCQPNIWAYPEGFFSFEAEGLTFVRTEVPEKSPKDYLSVSVLVEKLDSTTAKIHYILRTKPIDVEYFGPAPMIHESQIPHLRRYLKKREEELESNRTKRQGAKRSNKA